MLVMRPYWVGELKTLVLTCSCFYRIKRDPLADALRDERTGLKVRPVASTRLSIRQLGSSTHLRWGADGVKYAPIGEWVSFFGF